MKDLQDIDNFFYYGSNDLESEVSSDVLQNLLQPKRSLFYNRSYDAAGLSDYENYPDGMTLQVGIPYNAVESLAKRNYNVSDGQNGTIDRRVAVSQSSIQILRQRGEISVNVYFILLGNMTKLSSVSIPIGGTV
jgi:hypothetical protein